MNRFARFKEGISRLKGGFANVGLDSPVGFVYTIWKSHKEWSDGLILRIILICSDIIIRFLFEYTFGNVANSGADIGVLAEYHYDSRGADFDFTPPDPMMPTSSVTQPIALSSFQNDMFFGTRLALNDVQSTAFLGGGIIDIENGTTSLFAEASRRMGNQWTVSLEARGFANIDENDPFYFFRKDSYFEFLLSYYY